MNLSPFHLAIPVREITATREFYRDVLGCTEGRSSDVWVDFDFYGHQLVIHQVDDHPSDRSEAPQNSVDGHHVPVPHFGVVLSWEQWQELASRLQALETNFVIEPYIRFQGEPGEQATMFFLDPSGNALEFKAFKDINQLFAN